MSPRLRAFCNHLEASPRSFELSISNVAPVHGSRSASSAGPFSSIAEIGSRHALRIAVVSLAGELHFGFCAGPATVADLTGMARGIDAEAAELSRPQAPSTSAPG